MALVQARMRDGGRVDNCLIVSEHHCGLIDWNTKVSEGVPEVDDLLCTRSGSNILRAKCRGLDCGLQLGVPVDRRLVGEMKNASH